MNGKSHWMGIVMVGLSLVFTLCASGSSIAQAAVPQRAARAEVIRLIRQAMRDELEATTGQSVQDLKQALQRGKTIGGLITSSGHSIADFKGAVKAKVIAQITGLVSSQQLSQMQADRVSARLDTLLDKLTTHRFGQRAGAN